MLKTRCIEVEHTQMQSSIKHSNNYLSDIAESTYIHTSIHSTCSSHSLTENMVAEVKMDKITYLMKKSFRNQLRRCNVPPNHRPACSLISQQRYHPRAGHDSPRNKGIAGLHIAKDTQNTQPSQQSWVYQAIGSWRRKISKPVSSLQSQEHLHQN